MTNRRQFLWTSAAAAFSASRVAAEPNRQPAVTRGVVLLPEFAFSSVSHGCELSQAFARFGSTVYLIEALHGVLPNEDPEAAEIAKRALLQDSIEILCCGKSLTISQDDNGKRLAVDSHGAHYELTVDEILVGGGRTPNVENLGLELAGVAYDKSGVKVNDRLQTTNTRIYAAGDICSRYKFTHAADAMARIAIQNALFRGRAKASALTIPWCTYTDPEIAHAQGRGWFLRCSAGSGGRCRQAHVGIGNQLCNAPAGPFGQVAFGLGL
jgi:hypothetical protein